MQLCRFLKAAIDSQGGLDAGGVAAVVSPALQALLDQSDTRSLTDQMSEVSFSSLHCNDIVVDTLLLNIFQCLLLLSR